VFIVTPFVLDESPAAARDSTAPEHNDTPSGPENQAVAPDFFQQNKLENIRIRHLSAASFFPVSGFSVRVFHACFVSIGFGRPAVRRKKRKKVRQNAVSGLNPGRFRVTLICPQDTL